MKFLKYLLYLIILLTIIFYAMGLINPEITYDCEVTVDKSAAESWAVMSDEENLPQWIDGYLRSELVSGEANAVGAVSNVYVAEGESEVMMTETITDALPHKLMAMKFSMDFMDMDYKMEFEEEGGKTHIKTHSVTTGNGMIARSILSFMPSAMKSQEQKNLNSLKALIDQNTKDYFKTEATTEIDSIGSDLD